MAPKNILLLIADDLGPYLGCYNESSISTPNIDALARDGVLFSNAFTSTASCSASRSVINTGLHTHQNGQYGLNNGRHHFTTFDTESFGKVHVGPAYVYPWQVREESDTRNAGWVADRARAFFNKAKEAQKSFFLTVGYIDPHRDLTRGGFGNREKDVMNDERLKDVKEYKPSDVAIPSFLSDLPQVRQELAEYYNSIHRLDQGVGGMLAALENSGLAQDTLVVFVSDNGAPFVNSKTTLYDAGIRLPLMMRAPGVTEGKGIRNPNLVSFVDLLPTFLDWTGHGYVTSQSRKGRSILPVLFSGQEVQSWDRVFGSHTFHEVTNYWPTRFMRTKRFKYHRNIAWKLDFPFAANLYGSLTWEGVRNSNPAMMGPRSLKAYIQRPPEELYDLEADPDEVKNLAADPAYKKQLEEMRKETEEWQRETEDLWLFRDGVSVPLVQHHIDAGLKIPDQFDVDVEMLGSK